MPIPRLIQNLWIGDQSKRPVRIMDTWKGFNPNCEYKLWTEENLSKRTFVNQNKVDEMKELNGKCDIMRYEILYETGGLFVDADSECLNTLDDFFWENDRFTCYENEKKGIDIETKIVLIASSHMAFIPHDPLVAMCIEELGKIDMVGRSGWEVCGNRFFAQMILKYPQYPIKIYPSWYFLPVHGTGEKYEGTDKIYAKHYWGSTFNRYGTDKIT